MTDGHNKILNSHNWCFVFKQIKFMHFKIEKAYKNMIFLFRLIYPNHNYTHTQNSMIPEVTRKRFNIIYIVILYLLRLSGKNWYFIILKEFLRANHSIK